MQVRTLKNVLMLYLGICDVIRYFEEYQSPHHVKANGGNKYKNNCILKETWGEEKYYQFVQSL